MFNIFVLLNQETKSSPPFRSPTKSRQNIFFMEMEDYICTALALKYSIYYNIAHKQLLRK